MGGSIADIQKVSNADGSPIGGGSSVAQGTGTNKSGSITTGGTAQPLAALNASRRRFVFQNISGGDFWLSFVGTAAPNAAGSFRIQPGDGWEESGTQIITNAISIYGATTGQAWSAMEA